jgi:hypothetical protein
MATRTNWHLDTLELPDGDPMAEIEQLKSGAVVLDLRREPEEVMADLAASFDREARFSHYAGVECSIKLPTNRPPCYDCPQYVADPSVNPLGLICQLGRRQVDLLDELDAIRAPERLDEELAVAFEREQAACEELAAALV